MGLAPKHVNTSGHRQIVTRRVAWKFSFWSPAGNVLAQGDLFTWARNISVCFRDFENKQRGSSPPHCSSSPPRTAGTCRNQALQGLQQKGNALPDLPHCHFYLLKPVLSSLWPTEGTTAEPHHLPPSHLHQGRTRGMPCTVSAVWFNVT